MGTRATSTSTGKARAAEHVDPKGPSDDPFALRVLDGNDGTCVDLSGKQPVVAVHQGPNLIMSRYLNSNSDLPGSRRDVVLSDIGPGRLTISHELDQ